LNRERGASLLFCFNGTFLSLPLLGYSSFFPVDTAKIYKISIIVYRGGVPIRAKDIDIYRDWKRGSFFVLFLRFL
jgi:hypothetical protein